MFYPRSPRNGFRSGRTLAERFRGSEGSNQDSEVSQAILAATLKFANSRRHHASFNVFRRISSGHQTLDDRIGIIGKVPRRDQRPGLDAGLSVKYARDCREFRGRLR